MRKGLLYRSGDLHRLTPREKERLAGLHIRQVVDLREQETVRRRPDDFRPARFTSLPVRMAEFNQLSWRAALRRQVDWSRYDFNNLYVLILEENKDLMKSFLELLLEGPHPVLVHCTAGKDRTGVFVAVLLLALQVSRREILQWYGSIGRHLRRNTPFLVKFLVWYSGTPRQTIMLNFPAMEKMLAHLHEKYGNIEGYLAACGFSAASTAALRHLFVGKA